MALPDPSDSPSAADASDNASASTMLSVTDVLAAARLTPAWIEPYETMAVQLAAAETDGAVELLTELRSMRDSCGQIVGVETPAMTLTRAEWIAGNLFLTIAAAEERPDKMTMCQLVGIHSRIWELMGIEGTRLEYTQRAVIIRLPMVSGTLEFVQGSY